jgi:hypothetical protein
MEKDLYECNMMGVMELKEPCDSEALCDAISKKCDPPACQPDEYKCEGNALLKCSEDLTEFDIDNPSCPTELCDEPGKKCNKCMPSMVTCKDQSTLTTCATDGSGSTDAKCPDSTPICNVDKCVQCVSEDKCKPMSDCQTSTCMNGMCTAVQSKPVDSMCVTNGGKVCDLTGNCVLCNTDLNCSPSERCSLILGCVQRQALTVVSLIAGTYSVQVNAGYGLEITADVQGAEISLTAIGVNTRGNIHGPVLRGNESTTRTVTVTGPAGREANAFLPTLGTLCSAFPVTDSTATLLFAEDKTELDMASMQQVPAGTCGTYSVTIRAVPI